MINKIKDFLKNKLRKKAGYNLTDKHDLIDDGDDQTNPGYRVQPQSGDVEDNVREFLERERESTGLNITSEELSEGLENLPPSGKPNLKDKFNTSVAHMRKKFAVSKKLEAFKNLSIPKMAKKGDGPLISPSLSKFIEKFLSRSSRESIHQAALVLMIVAVTYNIGKITAIVIRGTPTLDTAKDYSVAVNLSDAFNPAILGQVKSTNIFRTNTGLGGAKKPLADNKCEKASQESNLPIKLVNTIVLQDTVKSLASVQIRGDRDLQEVRVGDQISNLAKIFKITRMEIVVRNLESGMCESIGSETKSRERTSPISVMSPSQSRNYKANKKISGIENEGNNFKISKTLLDDKLKDIASVLTQARAVKIQNPDGSLAFKMTELDPEGIFPYLGIQDGDIITSINGKPIYDMNEVMLLFGRIKGLSNLSLGIKRDGTPSTQEYSIKK